MVHQSKTEKILYDKSFVFSPFFSFLSVLEITWPNQGHFFRILRNAWTLESLGIFFPSHASFSTRLHVFVLQLLQLLLVFASNSLNQSIIVIFKCNLHNFEPHAWDPRHDHKHEKVDKVGWATSTLLTTSQMSYIFVFILARPLFIIVLEFNGWRHLWTSKVDNTCIAHRFITGFAGQVLCWQLREREMRIRIDPTFSLLPFFNQPLLWNIVIYGIYEVYIRYRYICKLHIPICQEVKMVRQQGQYIFSYFCKLVL